MSRHSQHVTKILDMSRRDRKLAASKDMSCRNIPNIARHGSNWDKDYIHQLLVMLSWWLSSNSASSSGIYRQRMFGGELSYFWSFIIKHTRRRGANGLAVWVIGAGCVSFGECPWPQRHSDSTTLLRKGHFGVPNSTHNNQPLTMIDEVHAKTVYTWLFRVSSVLMYEDKFFVTFAV